MKTLKYEEVFRQEYRDLAEARTCLERFIDKLYKQQRLHSALGYRPQAALRVRLGFGTLRVPGGWPRCFGPPRASMVQFTLSRSADSNVRICSLDIS